MSYYYLDMGRPVDLELSATEEIIYFMFRYERVHIMPRNLHGKARSHEADGGEAMGGRLYYDFCKKKWVRQVNRFKMGCFE